MASDEELLNQLQAAAHTRVAGGFDPLDEIVPDLIEQFAISDDEDDKLTLLHEVVVDEINAHLHAQSTWTAPTDCDHLDRAFGWLESAGVVSRQHFACCPPCGRAEIRAEITAAQEQGRVVRGYVFFHLQATESAVDGHGLSLCYGSVDPATVSHVKIGQLIVDTLREAGLHPTWSGSALHSITVPMRWQKRR